MSIETTIPTPAPAPEPKVEKIDPGFVEQFRDKLAFGMKREYAKLEGILGRETMAALSNYQPATRATLPKGVGYQQQGFIGTTVLPEIVAAPDGMEQASYPTYGLEALYSGGDDLVGLSGDVKRADLGVTWNAVTLDVRGRRAYIDPRELRAATAAGLNIYEKKAELIRGQVATRKEAAIATLLSTAGTYAGGHSATLSGTSLWSDTTTANPLVEVFTQLELVRSKIGVPATHFWMSPKAFKSMRLHPKITALIQYAGTKASPGAPVSAETIAAIFNVNVLLAGAVNVTTAAGAMADVWGSNAGLAFVNEGEIFAPQLGFTLTSAGYPKVTTYRDENQGAEGSEVVKYVEAYKPVVTLNTAGYLWINAGN